MSILLVEDNPGDIRLTREALKDARVRTSLHAVNSGEEALDFLLRRGEFEDAPRPDMIILDLNLPGKDGRDVLRDVKGHEDFRRIPVIVLTTSAEESDIFTCYDLHANCYITKPIAMGSFIEVVQKIDNFWFATAKLPFN